MKIGAIVIIMIVAILIILTFYVIGLFNKLIDARNRVEYMFQPIKQELNKIPENLQELIEIIREYTKREDKILSIMMDTKKIIIEANKINERINAYNKVRNAFVNLDKLAKTYPKLKLNKKFISSKKDLDEIDSKISYSSPFYNHVVLHYNKLIKVFPSNVVAYIFKFKEIEYINQDKNNKL